MEQIRLFNDDCLIAIKELPDNSVDSIVTDPPYHLTSSKNSNKGFMGKEWDGGDIAFRTEIWEECLRVLKPGGHLLAFGGTRTYHRMAVAIEDAGFSIRDQIMYIYGSGFPKSYNIGKAIDKIQGNEREVVSEKKGIYKIDNANKLVYGKESRKQTDDGYKIETITKGKSEWEGWGTALKPAVEPLVLARKPFNGGVAENVLSWGTGGLNIDESRIPTDDNLNGGAYAKNPTKQKENAPSFYTSVTNKDFIQPEGRFPANVIFDEEAGKILDKQSGYSKSAVFDSEKYNSISGWKTANIYGGGKDLENISGFNDEGGASRFFYCAKASKKDRNEGLESYIELFTSTIKLLYYTEKNLWEKEDQKTNLVDMDTSLQKVIEEYGVQLKNDLKWNTGLYGNYIMEQLQKDMTSIIKMETNLTTILQTLNLLIEKNTKIYIQGLLGEMVKDIKFVKDVEQKNTVVNITLQKMDGYWQNVNLVELNKVWSIRKVEGKSTHPTIKPTKLMEYLIKLITPKGGVVLDPFMGSGSTGKAAIKNDFNFIGIEREKEYFDIAKARIEHAKGSGLFKPEINQDEL